MFVEKRDGDVRFCIDFRALNAKTPLDKGPIGCTQDVLDQLADSEWFISCLDARSGFHQQEIDKSSRYKTAFLTSDGLFEWTRLPMGLNNAPASIARMMSSILDGRSAWFTWMTSSCIPRRAHTPLRNTSRICGRLLRAGLAMKLAKCTFTAAELVHLGHWIRRRAQLAHNGERVLRCHPCNQALAAIPAVFWSRRITRHFWR